MTVFNILRIHLRGVTVIAKVCGSSRMCWVEREVLISPGAITGIKDVLVTSRKCDSCEVGVTVFYIDCTQPVVFGYH